MNPRKKIFFAVKIAIAVVLVSWLFGRVDWNRVLSELAGVSYLLLGLYVILQIVAMIVSARKWQVIAALKGLSFSVKDGFFAYLTGAFINNFLPSTIGGDAYRGLWLAQKTDAKAASAATIVFDRFIGLWVTAILALIFLVVFFFEKKWGAELSVVFLFLCAFLLADAVITWVYREPWFKTLFAKWMPFPVRRIFCEVSEYMSRGIWIRSSLYALLFAFIGVGLSNYTLFASLSGTHINPLAFFSVIFIVVIVSSIPVSIGNIGIKEWAYFTFFPLAGISGDTAITVALLSRFLQMFISFAALPHYLQQKADRAVTKEQ